MELLTKSPLDSKVVQIIGDKIQSLQLLLPKDQSFIIKKENLGYFSKEIESEVYSDQAFLAVRQSQIDNYLVSTFLTKVTNKANNIGYVGLCMKKGFIIFLT